MSSKGEKKNSITSWILIIGAICTIIVAVFGAIEFISPSTKAVTIEQSSPIEVIIKDPPPPDKTGDELLSLGEQKSKRGYLNEARVLFDKAEAAYKIEKNNRGLADVYIEKAYLHRQLGQELLALEMADQAKEIYSKEKHKPGLNKVQGFLAGNIVKENPEVTKSVQIEVEEITKDDDICFGCNVENKSETMKPLYNGEIAVEEQHKADDDKFGAAASK